MALTFQPLTIRDITFTPPLFLAPMAGVSHSAFRRLIADFGGYGALYTEMLHPGMFCKERIHESPFTKRRPREGKLIAQLRLDGSENWEKLAGALDRLAPSAVDINLGCPAPLIRNRGAGTALFADIDNLTQVLRAIRRIWNGILIVKFRLGAQDGDWKHALLDRLHLFEAEGVDALVCHPRFFHEKLKRHARWEMFAWIAERSKLPLIGNGDILSPAQVNGRADEFSGCKGLMIGRIAVVKPWIFQEFSGTVQEFDYCEIWTRFYRYTLEDFPPTRAIGRIKEFASYFARNFFFGHNLYTAVQSSPTLEAAYERAVAFLSSSPRVNTNPSTCAGI